MIIDHDGRGVKMFVQVHRGLIIVAEVLIAKTAQALILCKRMFTLTYAFHANRRTPN